MAMEPRDPGRPWSAERGRLRASDADRDRVVDALKSAFTQGRLHWSELNSRTDQALRARTYADLVAAIDGIPPMRVSSPGSRGSTAAARQAAAPALGQPVNWKAVALMLGLILVLPGIMVAFFATYYGSFFILLSIGFVAAAVIGTDPQRMIPNR